MDDATKKKEEPKPAAPAAAAPKQPTQVPETKQPEAPKAVEPSRLPSVAQAPAPAASVSAPEPVAAAEEKPAQTLAELARLGALNIQDCCEVYSNSYNAWCPGVIYDLDDTAISLAYQVPGEPQESNISTKTLVIAESEAELRMPTVDGCWNQASVEVYSHSNKAWCLGKVTEITGGILSVVFFYPNEPPDAVPVMKQLPFADKDLRLRGIDAAFQPVVAGIGHETLKVQDPVEVYSNSLRVWCPGVVQSLAEGSAEGGPTITVAFYYPDMDPSKENPSVKELPMGHQDLRVPGFVTYAGPPVTEADITNGAQIEVFSQSRQAWILATVEGVQDGVVTVMLRYPDMPADSDLYKKEVQLPSTDLRLPGSAN